MKYPAFAVIIHWVGATIIIFALLNGFAGALDLYGPFGPAMSALNISLAVLLIPVFAVRIANRLTFSAPALAHVSTWQKQAARGVHVGLYAVTSFSLVTGVLMMTRPIVVFGLELTRPLLAQGHTTATLFRIHEASNVVLLGLVLLHVGAVVLHKHHKRPILSRMTI